MRNFTARTWIIIRTKSKTSVSMSRITRVGDRYGMRVETKPKKLTTSTLQRIERLLKRYQAEHVGTTVDGSAFAVSFSWSDLFHHKKVLMNDRDFRRDVNYIPDMSAEPEFESVYDYEAWKKDAKIANKIAKGLPHARSHNQT